MLILDIWGISFHDVVVFGLGKDILFKSVLGRCIRLRKSTGFFWRVGRDSPSHGLALIFRNRKNKLIMFPICRSLV